MPPELVSRLLDDRGPGIPDTLEVGVNIFVVGHGGVEHHAAAERALVMGNVRVHAAEHQIAVTTLDGGVEELPVFPGQGEPDVETEDFGVEANRGVDIRNS